MRYSDSLLAVAAAALQHAGAAPYRAALLAVVEAELAARGSLACAVAWKRAGTRFRILTTPLPIRSLQLGRHLYVTRGKGASRRSRYLPLARWPILRAAQAAAPVLSAFKWQETRAAEIRSLEPVFFEGGRGGEDTAVIEKKRLKKEVAGEQDRA